MAPGHEVTVEKEGRWLVARSRLATTGFQMARWSLEPGVGGPLAPGLLLPPWSLIRTVRETLVSLRAFPEP